MSGPGQSRQSRQSGQSPPSSSILEAASYGAISLLGSALLVLDARRGCVNRIGFI
ncbi:MAG: hypothetical protein JW820_06680 [Spirochaetales bacterium]|nr:hypothetical protein [Spirochaetales bacterium]